VALDSVAQTIYNGACSHACNSVVIVAEYDACRRQTAALQGS